MIADRSGERMQRVRIGLTGLACVFLLVLLAAAFFGLTNDERETGPLAVAPSEVPSANGVAAEAPREPLAELGVTPGYAGEAGPENGTAPAHAATALAPAPAPYSPPSMPGSAPRPAQPTPAPSTPR